MESSFVCKTEENNRHNFYTIVVVKFKTTIYLSILLDTAESYMPFLPKNFTVSRKVVQPMHALLLFQELK